MFVNAIAATATRLALSTCLLSSVALAQGQRGGRDSADITQLDTVVVTPERSATSIRTSAVAVSVIPRSWVRMLPLSSPASALVTVPGVAVVDVNSVGGNPRIIARGFYGGGETDYVSAQVDGVPIAALGSGAVDWDMLPPEAFSRLELVRGATSYLHGDAAVGGTLNGLIPVSPADWFWRAAGGSYGLADAALRATHGFGTVNAAIAGDYRSSDGYRTGERRTSSNLHAKIERYGTVSSLAGFILLHGRELKDPGPLLSTSPDRRARNGFFRFDRASERVDRAGLSATRSIGVARLSGYVVGEYATARAVKTLPLATDFADTKQRRTAAPRILTSGQVELGDDVPGRLGRLVAGLDASSGRLTSRYADVVAGDLDAYASSDGAPAASAPPSKASRTSLAGFAHWQLRPVAAVRFSLGARADRLSDKFVPSGGLGGSTERKTHEAMSPRVALNVVLPGSARVVSNAFVAAGRAFKSPTLDQLFDDRRIPIPAPPFSATVSNPDLVPQHGTSVEAGLYQAWKLTSGSHIDWSVALYREKMRDELDFDVNTFRYINIGRSLHRGAELGLAWETPGHWLAFGNFTQQRVVAVTGAFDGKQLKAIPRRIASAGINATLWRGLSASVVTSSLGGAYVDDENMVPLRGYTRVDTRIGIPFARARVTMDVMNAFNRRYDATAFPDPAGSAAIYRYPAAGRVWILGLETR